MKFMRKAPVFRICINNEPLLRHAFKGNRVRARWSFILCGPIIYLSESPAISFIYHFQFIIRPFSSLHPFAVRFA